MGGFSWAGSDPIIEFMAKIRDPNDRLVPALMGQREMAQEEREAFFSKVHRYLQVRFLTWEPTDLPSPSETTSIFDAGRYRERFLTLCNAEDHDVARVAELLEDWGRNNSGGMRNSGGWIESSTIVGELGQHGYPFPAAWLTLAFSRIKDVDIQIIGRPWPSEEDDSTVPDWWKAVVPDGRAQGAPWPWLFRITMGHSVRAFCPERCYPGYDPYLMNE